MSVLNKLGPIGLVNALFFLVTSPSFAQTSIDYSTQANTPEATTLTPEAIIAQRSRDEDERINYFGVGATIGVSDDGDTELGDGGFSLVGRFSFDDQLAIHSASVLGGDSFASFALTNSFSTVDVTEQITVVPFIGAGVGIEVDDFEVNPLVTAGVDVPISDLVTGTARVNAAFDDGTDIGVVLGVGIDVLSLF